MANTTISRRPGPLLEREAELERIRAALADARGGEGSITLVEGPAGIGKTRLLEEARGIAEAEGMTALGARGSEIEREFPFGIVRQLLDPTLAGASEDDRVAALAGAGRFAERVLGDERAEAFSPPMADADFSVMHGLYWVLSNLSDRRPLLVEVDDLQWADTPSLRFLAFLAPRVPDLALAVMASVRVGEEGSRRELLDRLAADGATAEIVPRGLSPEASAALLGRWLGAEPDCEFALAAHESVAGNPLLLRLLAEEVREEGHSPTAGRASAVRALGPKSVSRMVLLRLRALSRGSVGLARAIAVLGDGAQPDWAASLAGLSPEHARPAADELVRIGVLRSDGLAFTHPVVRNALYEDLGPAQRRGLHREAAGLMRRHGAPPERVASHLLAADPSGDPDVTAELRRAAEVARNRGAPDPAIRYLRRALEEPPPEADRPELLLELGAAEARAGGEAATEALRAAMATARDDLMRVRAAIELGQVLAYAGDIHGAAAVGHEVLSALEAAEDVEPLRRAVEMLLLVLAETDVSARPATAGLRDRADSAVDRLGARAPLGLLAIVAFERALVTGTAASSAPPADRALADGRLLDEQGPEAPHPFIAAGALVVAGRGELAVRRLGEVVARAGARGSARSFAFGSAMRAWAHYWTGDLLAAEADARACIELAPGPGWELFQAFARSALLDVLVERGELEAASSQLGPAAEIASAVPESVFTQPMRMSVARLALARHQPEQASRSLADCAAWERAWGAGNGCYVAWRGTAALNALALERREEASGLARGQVELAQRFGAPRQLGAALRAEGLVRGGEHGVELLRQAVAELEGSDARLEHARALVDLGAALRRSGHRRDARDPLRQGRELAHGCGAIALAERAGDELRATGARPRRVMLTGVESLTASERRVAGLAAGGLSNPEIAQSLFVTRKTVESHMRSVFRKLDISSRTELAPLFPADRD